MSFGISLSCCRGAVTRRYGSLVKRLRRRPLTAETRVRFPYELLTILIIAQPEDRCYSCDICLFYCIGNFFGIPYTASAHFYVYMNKLLIPSECCNDDGFIHYYDFSQLNNNYDCTNFVSHALLAGGATPYKASAGNGKVI